MPNYKLTADDAFALATDLRAASVAFGDYRFKNWDNLKNGERTALESAEWSLLNASSDATTMAVGLVLDDSELSFQNLKKATGKAKKAVQTLKTVAKILTLATAAVGLAAAIVAKDPSAIVKNAKGLLDAAVDA